MTINRAIAITKKLQEASGAHTARTGDAFDPMSIEHPELDRVISQLGSEHNEYHNFLQAIDLDSCGSFEGILAALKARQ